MWLQFAHLQYYSEYNQKVLNIFQKGPLEHAFSFSNTREKLHPPFQKYNVTNSEIQKVKQYYATALDLAINDIGVCIYIYIIDITRILILNTKID